MDTYDNALKTNYKNKVKNFYDILKKANDKCKNIKNINIDNLSIDNTPDVNIQCSKCQSINKFIMTKIPTLPDEADQSLYKCMCCYHNCIIYT